MKHTLSKDTKGRKIKLDISFTKDLKDKIIMVIPHDLRFAEFPFMIDIEPKKDAKK